MTAPAFLPMRPTVSLSTIRAAPERNQVAARDDSMRADIARDFAERQPVSTAAEAAAARAWPLFDRMAAMVRRAECACCAGSATEMCSELEDLERLIGEALRGAA